MSIIPTWLFEYPLLSLMISMCLLVATSHAGRQAFKEGLNDGYHSAREGKAYTDYVRNKRHGTGAHDRFDKEENWCYADHIEDEDIEFDNETEFTPDDPNLFQSELYADHSMIFCQECGIDLIVDHIVEQTEYCCPVCETNYIVSFSNSVLTIIFIKIRPVEMPFDFDSITLEDAYELFDADQHTSWNTIVYARKKLIQQYHPDKVSKLGNKLRELAESEGKRINIAYDLIKKHKQYCN